jgi:hypothetical protein
MGYFIGPLLILNDNSDSGLPDRRRNLSVRQSNWLRWRDATKQGLS